MSEPSPDVLPVSGPPRPSTTPLASGGPQDDASPLTLTPHDFSDGEEPSPAGLAALQAAATVDARFTDMLDLNELTEDEDTQTIADGAMGAVTITEAITGADEDKSPRSTEVLGNLRSVIRDRYRERGQLGRGGMATVYDSVDLGLRRHVAVKVLRPEHLRREDAETGERSTLQRFVEEAQITAQLEHPNIVPIHEIGIDRYDRVYFTMKRVEGDSLRSVFDAMREGNEEVLRQYPVTALCELFLKICDAIRFAHSRNVIHRDLKPDNIMVGRFGEVQVMDWGLAKVMATDASPSARETFTGVVSTGTAQHTEARHTMEGTISGTPAYMSPEQARGDVASVGMHSDVFLLGALLYEMITLVPPFHAESSMAALRRAQHYDLASPAQAVETMRKTGTLPDGTEVHTAAQFRVRTLPKELAAIALRAMARDPKKRYPRVLDLMDDVRRYLTNRPVSVLRDNPARNFVKWASRNPSLVTGLGLTIITLLIAGTLTTFFTLTLEKQDEEHTRAARERDRIERQREEEEQKRQQRRQQAEDEMQTAVDLLLRASTAREQSIITGYRTRALNHLSQAVYRDPTFVTPWFMRGYVNLDLGRLLDARKDFLQGNDILRNEDPLSGPSKQDPGTLMAAAMIAFTQHEMMQRDDAVEVYLACIQRVKECTDPTDDYYKLADILQNDYRALKMMHESQSDVSVVLEARRMREQTNVAIHSLLSKGTQQLWEVHLWAGWFDATSMAGWESPYSFDPQLIDSRRWDSRVYSNALEELNAAVDRRRQLPLAVYLRTRLHVAHQVSVRGARTLRQIEPDRYWTSYRDEFRDDPMGHYGFATLLLSLGNSSTGLRYDEEFNNSQLVADALARAIRLYPRFTEAYEAQAQNYEINGDFEGAVQKYGEILERWERGLLDRPSQVAIHRYVSALLRLSNHEGVHEPMLALADRLRRVAPELTTPFSAHLESELSVFWKGEEALTLFEAVLRLLDDPAKYRRLAELSLTLLMPEAATNFLEQHRATLAPGARLDELTSRLSEVFSLIGRISEPATPQDRLMLARRRLAERPTAEGAEELAAAATEAWALASAEELIAAINKVANQYQATDDALQRLQLARLTTRMLDRLYDISPRDAQALVEQGRVTAVVNEWLRQPQGS